MTKQQPQTRPMAPDVFAYVGEQILRKAGKAGKK